MFHDFGIDLFKASLQLALFFLIGVLPCIYATRRAFCYKEGATLGLWVALIWLVPILGWLSAMLWIRRPKRTKIYFHRGMIS